MAGSSPISTSPAGRRKSDVTLFSKERVPAKLIGDDHWTDLAIVQMDMDVIAQKKIDFSHAELGESKTLITGQDVMAIGTPFGLARTMTLGHRLQQRANVLSRADVHRRI